MIFNRKCECARDLYYQMICLKELIRIFLNLCKQNIFTKINFSFSENPEVTLENHEDLGKLILLKMLTASGLMEHVVSKFINRNDTEEKINFQDVDLIIYRISVLLDHSNMAFVMNSNYKNSVRINKTMPDIGVLF